MYNNIINCGFQWKPFINTYPMFHNTRIFILERTVFRSIEYKCMRYDV